MIKARFCAFLSYMIVQLDDKIPLSNTTDEGTLIKYSIL